MRLTRADREREQSYFRAKAKQFGTLHERMKYVMSLMPANASTMDSTLWHAIYDLQTEVSFYEPVSPPYGRRTKRAYSSEGRD